MFAASRSNISAFTHVVPPIRTLIARTQPFVVGRCSDALAQRSPLCTKFEKSLKGSSNTALDFNLIKKNK